MEEVKFMSSLSSNKFLDTIFEKEHLIEGFMIRDKQLSFEF